MMLPNWIIIGAPKASTSSLFRWLVDHPQVAGSAEKETYYFVDPGTHMFRPDRNFGDHGLWGYEQLFASCDPSADVVVEATPSYLYSETALRQLPQLPTRPSFIVVLREPVEQIRSLYSYFQQNWSWIPGDMTFRDFVEVVDEGAADFNGNELAANALQNAFYTEHLRRWEAAVGTDRMMILVFEDLVTDSRGTMRRVAQRMGINPTFYDTYSFPVENATYVARNARLQKLNIWLRSRLPQGALYRLLRSAYRAVNTRSLAEVDRELRTERLLSRRYAPMLEELERCFGLDLSTWKRKFDARNRNSASSHDESASSARSPAAERTVKSVVSRVRR